MSHARANNDPNDIPGYYQFLLETNTDLANIEIVGDDPITYEQLILAEIKYGGDFAGGHADPGQFITTTLSAYGYGDIFNQRGGNQVGTITATQWGEIFATEFAATGGDARAVNPDRVREIGNVSGAQLQARPEAALERDVQQKSTQKQRATNAAQSRVSAGNASTSGLLNPAHLAQRRLSGSNFFQGQQ